VSGTRFHVEQLSSQHKRAAFSCGVEPLDRYLKQQASQAVKRGLAAVYLLIESATNDIAGYYTLNSFTLGLSELPPEHAKKVGRYPAVPAILIGRLARDERYRGQGIGELLMTEALSTSLNLSKKLGVWAVVVDAKDDHARRFYESFGFMPVLDTEDRLFLPIKTVEELVESTDVATEAPQP